MGGNSIANYRPMAHRIVFMPGAQTLNLTAFGSIASEFGWSLETDDYPIRPAEMQDHRRIAAVCFCREAVGSQYSWPDALRVLASALPSTPLVPCHAFSENPDWDELRDAGAFLSLWLPLRESELRQCLGFVWQAQQRRQDRSTGILTRMAPARSSVAVQPVALKRAASTRSLRYVSSLALLSEAPRESFARASSATGWHLD